MNPQWHDEFVALCALFPSGELTEEEWALLQVHLAYCDSCRKIFDEYQRVVSDVIPMMAASAASGASAEPAFSLEAAEKRLMDQLEFVSPKQTSRSEKFPGRPLAAILAACILIPSGLVGLHLLRSKDGQKEKPAIVEEMAQTPKREPENAADKQLQTRLEAAESKAADLQQQISSTEGRYRQSASLANNVEQQLETEKDQREKISQERDSLSQQLAAARGEVQSLRDRSATVNLASSQQTTRTAELEARLREANLTLDEKDRMLTLDKEFLAHDREIRDLIAARNLYIADIYDVAQNGKTAKPFGRIFYTRDRSLVFYGYDLDKQPGLKQAVTFQAWGSEDDKQNVSLGLFYQDETQKRWVLRFNDTKTLARLNTVFVTAEPQGGSTTPTGKPLLLAYLQVQPNHP